MLKSVKSKSTASPQEVAVDNVGPVDDGTESLGDVPSLSEEVTGIDKPLPAPVGDPDTPW